MPDKTITTIVKVQRAIMPPDQIECLIYDEPQKHLTQQIIPSEALAAMKKRKGIFAYKAFFNAYWHKGLKRWQLGKIAEDQSW